MNIQESSRLWDSWAQTDPMWAILAVPEKKGNRWDADEFFATGEAEVARVMAHIERLGVGVGRGRALDFGCGMGRITQALAGYFREAAGVDVSPSMISLANRYNRRGSACSYHLNQEPHLGIFPDRSFDLVYSSLVLQHLQPAYIRLYIVEFLRVLAPGGLLVFDLPSREIVSWLKALRRRLSGLAPAALLRAYRRRRYANKWEMHGMPLESVRRLLTAGGATVLSAVPRPTTGWDGFQYFAVKGLALPVDASMHGERRSHRHAPATEP